MFLASILHTDFGMKKLTWLLLVIGSGCAHLGAEPDPNVSAHATCAYTVYTDGRVKVHLNGEGCRLPVWVEVSFDQHTEISQEVMDIESIGKGKLKMR